MSKDVKDILLVIAGGVLLLLFPELLTLLAL